jgi:hypothetical protein
MRLYQRHYLAFRRADSGESDSPGNAQLTGIKSLVAVARGSGGSHTLTGPIGQHDAGGPIIDVTGQLKTGHSETRIS